MQLTDVEKSVVKEAVAQVQTFQQLQQQITNELEKRKTHASATVDTIVKLRGLDPTKYRLKFDTEKDVYELEDVPVEQKNPPAEQTEGPSPEARVLAEGEVQVIAEMADGRRIEMDGSKAETLEIHSGGDGPPKSIAPAINMAEMERKIMET